MPTYIVKLTDKATSINYFMEWSTVVDAPVTPGMQIEEFKKYYQERYGSSGMKELAERLDRVEQTGTSSQLGHTTEEMISGNRAGEDENDLSYDEILMRYCLNIPA